MDTNIKRDIILEHYTHPKNKGLIQDERYIKINMNNESCIDEVNLMFLVEEGIVKDVKFDGEACAICTSSSSIMTDMLIGKTIEDIKVLYRNFANMIEEREYSSSILGEACAYEDIYKQPSRKKCALLPWWGIEKLMERLGEKGE